MSDEAGVVETPVVSSPGDIETVDMTAYSSMGGVEAPEEASQEETPTEEAPPVEEAPKKEKIAPKLAQLRAREAEAATKAAEAEARLAEANEKLARLEQLKKSPGKVLKELGLSFNDLATAILQEGEGDKAPDKVETLESKLAALEQSIIDKEQRLKDQAEAAQKQELDQAIVTIKKVIDEHISENPDQYELLKATGQQELVYEVMEAGFNTHGEVMPYKDACDLVENYLFDRFRPLADSKKLRAVIAPTVQPAPKTTAKTSFGKTLSSQLGQLSTANGKLDLSGKSHDEKIKILTQKVLRYN